MAPVKEVNVLEDWTLSIDHFYSIIKNSLGNLSASGKYQIQATAIPLDVSTDYEWFSRGMLNVAFDAALEPIPASESLSSGLQLRTKLSAEYRAFLSLAMSLVETKELDEDIIEKIDELEIEIENLSEKEDKLQTRLTEKWERYCELNQIDKGDLLENTHWLQGQPDSYRLIEVRDRMRLKVALQIGLRDQQYENPNHKELLEAYKRVVSPAATMRYPRFEDTAYTEEEQAKFGVVYFASKPAHESSVLLNEYMMTPTLAINTIATADFGKLSSEVTKTSEASESITTDWSFSGSVKYGPFKMKTSVSSHEQIETDFKAAQSVTVSVESLMAIPYIADTWFTPSVFDNALIKDNPDMFHRWLGENGSLRIYPTHLVVCRGLKIHFNSTQDWEYDYESDFKAGGSASASVFGIGFGGGGSYHKHVERQKVERRGHTLTFDDGEKNIRIIGYHTVTNPVLDNIWELHRSSFDMAARKSEENLNSLRAKQEKQD